MDYPILRFLSLKAIFFFKMLLLLLISREAKSQNTLENGLIGCYTFSGNSLDLSGSGNHGTVNGAKLVSDRFGNPGSAYDFNGYSDYIELDPKILQINQFSYSLWVYPKELPRFGEAMFLISVGSTYGDQHILLGNHYSNSRHTGFSHGCYQGIARNISCTVNDMPQINKWYHLVLSKTETHYTLYVDGQVVCRDEIRNESAFYGTGSVKAVIGARNNYGQASNVIIDDVHLYNRALTAPEVNTLYTRPAEKPLSVNLFFDNNASCGGELLTINAVVQNPGVKGYEWSVESAILSNETTEKLTYLLPEREHPYTLKFSVQVSPEHECFSSVRAAKAEKSIEIQVCTSPPKEFDFFIIPNAFTPNSDGINDTWKVNLRKAYPDLNITVYNRWGEVIFQTDHYIFSWNGTYLNKPVPSGTYAYTIKSGNRILKQGSLNIIY